VERELTEQRQQDLEVERQGADQGHHRQRDQQLWLPAHVRDRLAHAAAVLAVMGGGEALGVHAPEGDDHRAEGRGVEQEAGGNADGGDQRPGSGRPEDPGGVDQDAVESHRVDHLIGADQLDHEALARRVVDRVDRAAHENQREHHPRLDRAGHRQAPERERRDRHRGLRDDQQRALREAIRDHAAPGAKNEDRQELEGRGDADRDPASGQLEDQPHLGDHLHPVAAQGDDLAGEVAPVVGNLK
jgi:hypothetical protein